MFDPSTPASSSSSTLVTTTTTTDSTSSISTFTSTSTSTQSLIPTPNSNATDSKPIVSQNPKPRPRLSLNTSTDRLGTSNSPKMSDKGFIQPHASHLPRRTKRPRTKTALEHEPLPQLEQQEREQQLEQLREQLQLYHLESASETRPNNTNAAVGTETDPASNHIQTTTPPQAQVSSTYPHRDNLPRRARVHERAKTAPTHSQTRRIPAPLPISMVDSQSTIEAEPTILQSSPKELETETLLSSPTIPPPFKFNSKALSLISKAQNKAFQSHIVIDHGDNYALDNRRPSSPTMPTSPQLPHPAMGLTMGIMEAYATESENGNGVVGTPPKQPAQPFWRSGLSYSPALGVKGTPPPPPPDAGFAVGTTRFVPISASSSMPNESIPRISITKPTPELGLMDTPVSAPLGQNLPRRHHRYRRREPQPRGGEEEEKREVEVLRFERVRAGSKVNRVEGNEEEDGLYSSLLDFERAGSGGVVLGQKVGDSRERRKGGEEEERSVQVLGKSCVEVGYMRESEVKEKGEHVLIEGDQRRLELCLPDDAAVCTEGVPSLLPEQLRTGCEFMKGLGKGRIRISVPRWRAQDALALAVCFLVGAGPEEYVPLEVNNVVCLDSYTPIHQLYMRLLDDGHGGEEEEREWGKGKGGAEEVGLGLVGVDLGPQVQEEEVEEGGQSARSTSTTGSSRPTLVRRGHSRHHVREAALGGSGWSSSSSLSSASPKPSGEWTGLRDEWRGVLSYEGLNTLVGVWP